MMYVSHKELFYRANSNNSIKSKINNHPAKPKYPQKRKTGRKRQFFSLRRDFCLRRFYLRQKKSEDKKSKNGKLAEDKKTKTSS